ncbi:MAG: ABC transporter ATP-binding protein [Rhodospirillaceae bacterium]|nr:ABC transporter ATP-binding protein [Rhodospirillaceae bacterium]
MPIIKLENIQKKFGQNTVLDGIDLVFGEGEFTVLVGPSGCGKTTLLRLIAGLEQVSGGKILIGDRDVTKLEPRERDIAMVFQNYALYPHMSVYENMGFGLKARGVDTGEIKRRVMQVAEMLGIEVLLNRKPKELSGGQQQRVAIGRAVVRDPSLFLFDEPLSNLDAKLRTEMRTELLKLHRELHATTVYVTHDQEEAMGMGDCIVVLNDGVIQQRGTPREIYFHPINLLVAGFIGSPSMNMVHGQISAGTFTSLDGVIVLETKGQPDGDVILGVRPEDIHRPINLADRQHGCALSCRADVIELLGARAIITLAMSGTELKAVFEERYLKDIVEGSPLTVVLDLDRLHFFDAATGQRLNETAQGGELDGGRGANG